MRKITTSFFVMICSACFSQEADTNFLKYFYSIKSEDLKMHLEVLASDGYEGRFTGERGQKLAAFYMSTYFEKIGAKKFNNKTYTQEFVLLKDSLSAKKRKIINGDLNTENVIAIIEGSDLKNECIVISAHYDHLGKKNSNHGEAHTNQENNAVQSTEKNLVYNGADDDGSGTVALLEIAEAFMLAKKNGHGPRRTIIIAAFTAEELGLWGSKYYVRNPVMPLKNTVANLNIDMIGRIDKNHTDTINYIYLIGSDKISSELKAINENNNNKYTNLVLDYRYDINDEDKYYYRSDHYNFAKNNVPVVFYFNGVHEDYHKETDEVEKINYNLIEIRTRLIFATAWDLANRNKRIIKDKLQ